MSITSITEAATQALANPGATEMQQPAPESVSRFEELMQQPLVQPGNEASHSVGGQIAEAIERQDSQTQAALQQVESLAANVGSLSPLEAIGASGQVALNVSLAQFDFQTKMAVVTSTKSSAETLMKNQ
jgi:type III secretion inner rod protein HrpB2